jgi:hypothetical protein
VPRPQCQHSFAGGVDIIDHDVEVDLLGNARRRPGRRNMVRSQLKGHARRSFASSDDAEVVASVRHRVSQQQGIELRQHGGVTAIKDDVVETPDHSPDAAMHGG